MKSKLQKSSSWWSARTQTLSLKTEWKLLSTFSMTSRGRNDRFEIKSVPGRGRKLRDWVSALYAYLRNNFEILRSAGLNLSSPVFTACKGIK